MQALVAVARRPGVALFALVFGAYAYFYQAGGWNQNSRFDMVRAIVEQGTHEIDGYYRNTGDLACQTEQHTKCNPWRGRLQPGEHAYCDKSPGVSWIAVPPYWVMRGLAGGDSGKESAAFLSWTSYGVTVWTIGIPSALAVVALFGLLGLLGLSHRAAVAVALAYGLGTLAFPYATVFYGHQLIAALLLLAFYLLVRARSRAAQHPPGAVELAGAGLLLGLAVVVEYPAALAVIALCVYAALFVRPWPRLGWIAAGGAVPAIALGLYHQLVFGGALTLPYNFSTQKHRHMGAFMGLGWPDPDALWGITFSSYRGLFYSAPWLLLGAAGIGLLARRRAHRAEAVVCAAVVLLFVWLNASLVDWQGGWAMGARYLVPCIPFLAVGAAGVVLAWRGVAGRAWWLQRAGQLVTLALVLYSGWHMLAGTAVKPEVPVTIRRPYPQYLMPKLYAGELAVSTQSIDMKGAPADGARHAWNLGHKLGLSGGTTLVPLAVYFGLCGGWLGWAVRRRRAQGE